MTSIIDRYSTAVHARSLKANPETMADGTNPARTAGAVDVLGAAAFAGHRSPHVSTDGMPRPTSPLGIAVLRLLAGDDTSSGDVVEALAPIIEGRAFRTSVQITRIEAVDMARALLAWHRFPRCGPCSGLGRELEPGTPVLSNRLCTRCRGSGLREFDREFSLERLELARWCGEKLARETASAGAAMMAALAPRLEL